MALNWDRLTPAMKKALRDPKNREPLRFDSIPGERYADYEVDERQHVDRKQARDLRQRLTEIPDRGTISGSYDLRAIEEEDPDA